MSRSGSFVILSLLLPLLLACTARPVGSPTPNSTAAASSTSAPANGSATAPAAPTASSAIATSTTASGPTIELTVFAAASLTAPFKEIGKEFEADNPGAKVTFSFAGSQQLAQQLNQGAPADVFASADSRQMDVAVQGGSVDGSTPRVFVRNRLVVIYPVGNPAKLAKLQDLARPRLKIVLADKTVPVGSYALTFLDKASQDPTFGTSYKTSVLKNVVSYEQDVKAVLSKVELGEADAGIVYTTDVTPDAADKVGRLDIPDRLNTIAVYSIAVVKGSPHADLARKFVVSVLASKGQAILAKYGFIPVDAGVTGAPSLQKE